MAMVPPVLLFLASIAGIGLALLPGWSDLMLLAAPCTVASLWLLYRGWRQLGELVWPRPDKTRPRPWPTLRGNTAPKWVVVDGSNVMHWRDGTPQIETLRAVLFHLAEKGYTPCVVFDANAGYKLAGSYKHDHAFGRLLGLPEDQVMVVPKGSPADPTLLAAARDLNARIVSNDRFRDWAEKHPIVSEPGRLIRGGIRDGDLWLDLGQSASPTTPE